ncbi:GNAT family N-acetyltransferase [Brevibacillus sp. B_LB10_24]|uniref:GNAT family N-acetyltransferase n=1 Tax=Brevibacillus sp. B_LB10_24 TaxID=3380645 RepID=UPI0038BA5379
MRYRHVVYQDKPYELLVRNYQVEDFPALFQVQRECFPEPFPQELLWSKEQIQSHVRHFPEGAICVEHDGKVVGSITGLIVRYHPGEPHTWSEITDNGYIRNHDPSGDSFYIVDVSVMPQYRSLGLGRLLMQAVYYVTVHMGLARVLGGGRIPGYHKLADQYDVQTYVDKVAAGEWTDPVMTFLLRCGRRPVQVMANYLDDEESCNHAVLMEWRNPFFDSLMSKKV